MPNILVRDLPEDIHALLRQRADAAGQSLQQFLAAELTRLATTPTMGEVLERLGGRSGGRVGFDTAVDDIAAERSRR